MEITPNQNASVTPPQSNHRNLIAVLIIVILILIAVIFYFLLLRRNFSNVIVPTNSSITLTQSGETENLQPIKLVVEDCNDCKYKNLSETASGFQMKFPSHWGTPTLNINSNAGEDIASEHKNYADGLYFPAWITVEGEITFSNITKNDPYKPTIYLINKKDLESSDYYKDFNATLTGKTSIRSMTNVRREFFKGCNDAEMFWYFGNCKNAFLTPVLVSDRSFTLGFEPGTLATSYSYSYIIEGDDHWVVVLLDQNTQSDVFKVMVANQTDFKADYVNLVDADNNTLNSTNGYSSELLEFLKLNHPDKLKALEELKAIIESINFKEKQAVPTGSKAGLNTYTDSKYNFKFQYPDTVRLLTLIKADGADPLIVSFKKDASLYTILVTDDEEQYPIPKMLRMSEQKMEINNINVIKTKYFMTTDTPKFDFIGYDFVLNGQPYLFASDANDTETQALIESVIKTFTGN